MLDDVGQDFLVVRNNELSVWPAELVLPGGWSPAGGPARRKSDCLGYMAGATCDMSALSTREGQGTGSA